MVASYPQSGCVLGWYDSKVGGVVFGIDSAKRTGESYLLGVPEPPVAVFRCLVAKGGVVGADCGEDRGYDPELPHHSVIPEPEQPLY